jgi:carbonic anhydrase
LDPLVQRVKYLELGAKDPSKDEVNKVVKDNITEQVKNIRNSEAVANAWKEGKEVFVHGWIYNLDDGFIEPVPM